MRKSHTLLLVEDDLEIGGLLRDKLEREGFQVIHVRDGRGMDEALVTERPDLLILDLMLPGEDGLSICRRMRTQSQVPILMLTAKCDDLDRIVGLEVGADDYLAKPFNPRELLARIRAILRRTKPSQSDIQKHALIRFADFQFYPDTRRLIDAEGNEITLTAGDFDLLTAFVEHPLRVLSRDQLMDLTKGRKWDAFDRSIDVAALRLRRKLEVNPAQPKLIKTVRNGGYLFACPVQHE